MKITQQYIRCSDSNGNRSSLLFLLHCHLRSSGSVLSFEVVLPILAVLAQIFFESQMRFHPSKRVAQMIYIFVGPAWPKTIFNQIEVFIVELFSLLRVIYFKYAQRFHHLPWLNFVSALSEDGRNNHLKVGANRHKCSMIVIHVCVGKMLERIVIAFIYQHEIFLVDIFIVFECIFNDFHVVQNGLQLLGGLVCPVFLPWRDGGNLLWTGLLLHHQYLIIVTYSR